MRKIKQILIVLLALLTIGQIATIAYQSLSQIKEPPVISCPSEPFEVSVRDPESVLLTGITATDPQDGDLTDQVIIAGISTLINNDTVKVTYLVFDSDDNMGSCVRYVRYTDYRRPQFEIKAPLVYSTTEELVLLDRLSAYDVIDGDISDQIRITTMSTETNSEITRISVLASNSLSVTSTLELPVLRLAPDPLRPTVTLSDYLIYLDTGSAFDPQDYLLNVSGPLGELETSQVVIDANVETSKPGVYEVTYTYDFNGHVGTAILTVVVL